MDDTSSDVPLASRDVLYRALSRPGPVSPPHIVHYLVLAPRDGPG
jgi:hypothetical protein